MSRARLPIAGFRSRFFFMQTWTVDAHCHWSDARLFARARTEIPRLIATGIAGFQLGGVDPEEWERQNQLSEKFPARFWRAFGLHPYFVARHSLPELESAWLTLETYAREIEAIGETGLDFRKQFAKDNQLAFFERHLVLARIQDKPLILHIVRAHEEALHALKDASTRGMVHAFTAGPKVAKRYLDLGYSLSIGAKLLHPEAHDLRESVRFTPLERLLIESDCPDQPPPNQKEHDSSTVFAIAEKVSGLKSLAPQKVIEQTRGNLFALIGKEFRP